jgi:hypothetical protein
VANRAPIRGTQSFVDVMVAVWKRPSLTAIEVVWRWLVWLPAWFLLPVVLGSAGMDVRLRNGFPDFDTWRLETIILLHGGFIVAVHWRLAIAVLIVGAMVALVWAVVSGVGRDVLLRRFDSRLQSRLLTMSTLAVLRVLCFDLLLALWLWIALVVLRFAVIVPNRQQIEPSYLGGFALVLFSTLALFVFWTSVSWIFRLAPVLAMARNLSAGAAIRAAWRSGLLRGKLIEINLVMGIVKIALIVLAMVFSACPLPFSNVETQTFLACWWGGVAVWWLVISDYFHVVRAAAYLRLWRAYEVPPGAEAAS